MKITKEYSNSKFNIKNRLLGNCYKLTIDNNIYYYEFTKENDVVLDCFGGSGSTLIAAERSGRRARLIEISPRYVDVIIFRYEKETGKKHKIIKNFEEDKNV